MLDLDRGRTKTGQLWAYGTVLTREWNGHLARKQMMRRDSLILYAASDCAGCSLKPRCTTAERHYVTRRLHEVALDRMNARFHADRN